MAKRRKLMNVSDKQPETAARLPNAASRTAASVRAMSDALNAVLADMFALYLKTKNFHWHVTGSHFRDYHLMLDGQAGQILAATDPMAERVRKIGGSSLRSIGHIARLQRVLDNDANYVAPVEMLTELRQDNLQIAEHMRHLHALCGEHQDVATASLLETWIDEAEGRSWFLLEATHPCNGEI
jgi:starvation-inducible DNA-binding protein